MDKKNISPNPQKPVDRVPAGQLPSALAELTEAALSDTQALPLLAPDQPGIPLCVYLCSYDGDDE